MKTLFCLVFLCGSAAWAQTTVNLSAIESSASGATAVSYSMSVSTEAIAAIGAWCTNNSVSNLSLPGEPPTSMTTTVSAVASTDATVSLSSVYGLTAGMGLLIDSEIMLITSVDTGTGVASVARATLGTTAASHLTAAPVSVLQCGGIMAFLKQIVATQVRQVMMQTPGPAISTAQTTITTDLANAVQ